MNISQALLDEIAERCSREGLKGNLVLHVQLPTLPTQDPHPIYCTKVAEWTHGWDIDPH